MSGLVKTGIGFFTGGSSTWIPLAVTAGLGALIAGGIVWWVKGVEVGHANNAAIAAQNEAKKNADALEIAAARNDDLVDLNRRNEASMLVYQHDLAEMRAAAAAAQSKSADLSRSYATVIKELKDARKNAVAISPDTRDLLPYVWCMQQHRGDANACASGSPARNGTQ